MSKRATTEEFIESAKAIHGNKYRYDLVDYRNSCTKVKIICPIHGVFEQVPSSHLAGKGCKKCAYDSIHKKYYGIGINDVPNAGKTKAYHAWRHMLCRCYSTSPKDRKAYKTYDGCVVCDEWHHFSNFQEWFDKNYKDGYELDKDILSGKHNKIYSPQTCTFVPKSINTLLTKRDNNRGKCCIGVVFRRGVYEAMLSTGDGIPKFLGTFHTEIEAFNCYKEAKEKEIKRRAQDAFANGMIDTLAYRALLNYKVDYND